MNLTKKTMLHILEVHALPPDKKTELFKQALREARNHLCNAQIFIGPLDSRYQELMDMIAWMEEEIVKKNPSL